MSSVIDYNVYCPPFGNERIPLCGICGSRRGVTVTSLDGNQHGSLGVNPTCVLTVELQRPTIYLSQLKLSHRPNTYDRTKTVSDVLPGYKYQVLPQLYRVTFSIISCPFKPRVMILWKISETGCLISHALNKVEKSGCVMLVGVLTLLFSLQT